MSAKSSISVCVPFLLSAAALLTALQTAEAQPRLHRTLSYNKHKFLGVAFSPDGKKLAAGTFDGSVLIWDVATGTLRRVWKKAPRIVKSVDFSADGKLLASTDGRRGIVEVTEIATDRTIAILKGHGKSTYTIAFSPDGKILAAAGTDMTIKLWNTATWKRVDTLRGHTDHVRALAFSSDGKTLASGTLAVTDNTIRLWDIERRRTCHILRQPEVIRSLAFSPDGKYLAWGGDNDFKAALVLWDRKAKRAKSLLDLWHAGKIRGVLSVAFSPDSKTLASGNDDRTVRLWDVSTGKNTVTLKGHTHYVQSVAFNPDGRLLASSISDRTIRLWKIMKKD